MEKLSLNKRQQRAEETKQKIYESARQLALQYGIENVSVDSIVEAAGVSKGSFYVHFESKDALTAAFINEYTDKADLDYQAFLNTLSDNHSTTDILLLLAEEIASFIEDKIGSENMRVVYKGHLTKTINTSQALSYQRQLYQMLITLLEKGISQGELRDDIPIDSLAKHLVLAIRGITFEWCIRYPDYNLKEQVAEHVQIILYGLRKQQYPS